jgi:glycosyltransferase involved in cell wall biosynthesis
MRYDIIALLQAMDIFVIPSFFEGYSNSLLEAMASGKAIVASDIPSNREILGKDGGFLFNPSDIHALEAILVELVNNSRLRAKWGMKARQLARRYDLDKVCEDFVRKLNGMATKREKTGEVHESIDWRRHLALTHRHGGPLLGCSCQRDRLV